MWIAFIALCLGVIYFMVEPIIYRTPLTEIRLYIRGFLFMFALNTFAVLRLYNSIVQNTRFSIKLREALVKVQQLIPGLERSMKNLNSSLGNAKASSDALKKSTDNNSDKVEKLTDKINHLKTN